MHPIATLCEFTTAKVNPVLLQKYLEALVRVCRLSFENKGLKDRAHQTTFKIFIFEKFSCFIVLVVFLVIVQSSELVSVWFCKKKMTFFLIFLVTTSLRYMWAGLPLGLPTACRLIRLSTLRPVANDLLNDALRLDNELSALAATCSLRSVSKVQINHLGLQNPL